MKFRLIVYKRLSTCKKKKNVNVLVKSEPIYPSIFHTRKNSHPEELFFHHITPLSTLLQLKIRNREQLYYNTDNKLPGSCTSQFQRFLNLFLRLI